VCGVAATLGCLVLISVMTLCLVKKRLHEQKTAKKCLERVEAVHVELSFKQNDGPTVANSD